MRLSFVTALMVLGVVSAFPKAPLVPLEETEDTIAEEYIVVFKKKASGLHVEDHMEFLNTVMLVDLNDTYHVKHIYDMGPNLRGYAAHMNDQMLESVRGRWEVDYVERNQRLKWSSDCEEQFLDYGNWGLSRISHVYRQTDQPLTYRYNKNMQGEGAYIYIIDSGIDVQNPEFEGRAIWGADYVDQTYQDTIGHGTNVAGIAISKTYGVAKKAIAVAVRIEPTKDSTLAGINWVKDNHGKGQRKSIANMSFGIKTWETWSGALNAAANALVDAGVPVVVAAGNEPIDACNESPASADNVITVAASDRNDEFASWSAYGKCVDIIAPGVDLETTGLNNQTDKSESGTSLSAPYVAGVLAKIMANGYLTPNAAWITLMFDYAITNKIKNVPIGTYNEFLNDPCYE